MQGKAYSHRIKLYLFSIIILLYILITNILVQAAMQEDKKLPAGGVEKPFFVQLTEDEITSAPIYCKQNQNITGSYIKLSNINSIDGGTDYGYSSLNPVQKTCYTKMMDAAFQQFLKGDYKNKDYSSKEDYVVVFSVDCTDSGLTLNDLLKVYFAYRHDNPQYYWLSTGYSYAVGKNVIVTVCMDMSYAKASVRKQCDAVIAKVTKEYIAETENYSSIYDIVLAVHDKIITDIDYAYDKNGNPSEEIWAHSIMGVFEKRGAVCEGYAKAFQYILNILGIDTIYVIGDADGGAHAWNLVKIDDEYYCMDITWDDFNDLYNDINYIYFCMPGNKFALTHTAYRQSASVKEGKWLYKLPKESESYEKTYYVIHNSYAADLTKDTVNSFLQDAKDAKSGNNVHILSDLNSKSVIAEVLKLGCYEYKNYGYLFIIENYIGNNDNTMQTVAVENHIFLDREYKVPVKKGKAVIWAGWEETAGSSADNRQILSGDSNLRQIILYTDVAASGIETTKDNESAKKTGKVIVGITLTNETPVLKKNKIIDPEAAKIAKASVQNGRITVRAQKEPGTVYLWVYDTGDAKVISCVPVIVKELP